MASLRQKSPLTPRTTEQGDVSPSYENDSVENFSVSEKLSAARASKSAAVEDILRSKDANDIQAIAHVLRTIMEGASPDDALALRNALLIDEQKPSIRKEIHNDDMLADDWRDGGYPYKNLLSRRSYEKQKYQLQVELLKLQAWVKETGQRVVILFEGRDAAGKGGTIKRMMEHLNPRGAHVVALEKPTELERGQWYFQRYISHLPSAGEIVLFDRSWYNRAGVERVMGFCSDEEYNEFMRQAPEFERNVT